MERNDENSASEAKTDSNGDILELDADSYSLYCFLEEYDDTISNHEEMRKLCQAADKITHPH